jgi:hypothetical protein
MRRELSYKGCIHCILQIKIHCLCMLCVCIQSCMYSRFTSHDDGVHVGLHHRHLQANNLPLLSSSGFIGCHLVLQRRNHHAHLEAVVSFGRRGNQGASICTKCHPRTIGKANGMGDSCGWDIDPHTSEAMSPWHWWEWQRGGPCGQGSTSSTS